jgi:hypothetical protein
MNDYSTEQLDSRLSQIDQKLDNLTTRLTSTDERELRMRQKSGASRTDRTFWGIFLVVLGGLWLGDRMGWVDISAGWLWPTLLIGFGLYLMLGGRYR